MVLQRNRPNIIRGWDRPGQQIKVFSAGEILASALTDAEGRWRVTLPALSAGGPHEWTIEGSGVRALRDIRIGEVWLCAGQSNMQFPVAKADHGAAEAAAADFPHIRLFAVKRKTSSQPLNDVEGSWLACSPETVKDFSAVGYFFGKKLLEELDMPVGLIDISWGGSPIEAWTALEDLERDSFLIPLAAQCRDYLRLSGQGGIQRAMDGWQTLRDAALEDPKGLQSGWAEPGYDDSRWIGCPVPGTFDEAVGEMDGAVWYRRKIEIPPAWAGRDLELHLGVVDDLDHSYWNGRFVGKTGTETPQYYKHSRIYTVPGAYVKTGSNLLAVRVFDEYLSGGFISLESDLWIAPPGAGEEERLPLAGLWKINVEQILPEKPWAQDQPQAQPEGIFNAMLAPLIPFGIRGVLWYQGENNLGYPARYARLFPLMVEAWRRRWQQGDFPFLFVQLANFGLRHKNPAGSCWAELREAQSAALNLPNTAMVTAIDVGAGDDIHPTNKQAVGLRLAANALAQVYSRDLTPHSGPTMDRLEQHFDTVRITFRHAQGGLRTTDHRPPQSFAFVADDGRAEWAQSRIEGSTVVLSCPAIPDPVMVKYAWADNPEVNLVNQSGFPAFPFKCNLPFSGS